MDTDKNRDTVTNRDTEADKNRDTDRDVNRDTDADMDMELANFHKVSIQCVSPYSNVWITYSMTYHAANSNNTALFLYMKILRSSYHY